MMRSIGDDRLLKKDHGHDYNHNVDDNHEYD